MIFILMLSAACWSILLVFAQPPTTSTVTLPIPTLTSISPSPTDTITPASTDTPPSVSRTEPAFTTTSTPLPAIEEFTVQFHPDDVLYVGDQVSIEVIPPPGVDVKQANLQVQVDPPDGLNLGPSALALGEFKGVIKPR